MLSKIISKPAAALLCALFMLAPAPSYAWNHLCMHAPFFKTWFASKFQVFYGFPGWWMNYNTTVSAAHSLSEDSTDFSGNLYAAEAQCLSIQEIEQGKKFAVYLEVHGRSGGIWCETHWSNPNSWYTQVDRGGRFRVLWYEVTGSVFKPRCKFRTENTTWYPPGGGSFQ